MTPLLPGRLCPDFGKVSFPSFEAAADDPRRAFLPRSALFPCLSCGGWHHSRVAASRSSEKEASV